MATNRKSQRLLALFSLLLILALVLGACAPAAPAGEQAAQPAEQAAQPAAGSKILLYDGNQDIDNIDPATGENYSINAALISLYDALFITRGNELQPNLVESYEVSDDAKVFTFKLKQNAKFHDGSPVNADAVVYSFNRLITLQGPPTYR